MAPHSVDGATKRRWRHIAYVRTLNPRVPPQAGLGSELGLEATIRFPPDYPDVALCVKDLHHVQMHMCNPNPDPNPISNPNPIALALGLYHTTLTMKLVLAPLCLRAGSDIARQDSHIRGLDTKSSSITLCLRA